MISAPALVRDRARSDRCSYRGQAGCTNGGKIVTPVSALLIFVALILYILGQLFLKHAMESDLRSARFKKIFAVGLATMTFSFFITLGITPAFRPQLSLSLSGIECGHHQPFGGGDFAGKINTASFFSAQR